MVIVSYSTEDGGAQAERGKDWVSVDPGGEPDGGMIYVHGVGMLDAITPLRWQCNPRVAPLVLAARRALVKAGGA